MREDYKSIKITIILCEHTVNGVFDFDVHGHIADCRKVHGQILIVVGFSPQIFHCERFVSDDQMAFQNLTGLEKVRKFY